MTPNQPKISPVPYTQPYHPGGCSHYPGDMAMRMRKVLARPCVGIRVCHLLLLIFLKFIFNQNMFEMQ